MYKVFVNEDMIQLAPKTAVKSIPSDLIILGKNILDFSELLKEMSNSKGHGFAITTSLNPVDFFCKKLGLKHIQAGGGLVQNDENKLLVIFRRGKWDLPKGKLDKGETIEDCALREVAEECGVSGLQLIGLQSITYHIYKMQKEFVLKESFWFNMNCSDKSKLIPQIEEEIEICQWQHRDKIKEIFLQNTYQQLECLLTDSGWVST
jgi:8-oxo-dGTP pyrophosphatase MutT (NUDIX family)